MTTVNLLKQEIQLYVKKINLLNEKKEITLKKANEDFTDELYLEKLKEINSEYNDTKNEYKAYVLNILSECIEELKKKVVGKSTTDTVEAMSDITLLQLLGTINESQLEIYADKYKEYPMILSYLKQIANQNGFCLSYKNIDDANKIIKKLENKTKDLIENYTSTNKSDKYQFMLLDKDGYYDRTDKSLNDFIQDTAIKISKFR